MVAAAVRAHVNLATCSFNAIGSEVSRVPISLEHLPTLDEFVRLAVAIAEGSR